MVYNIYLTGQGNCHIWLFLTWFSTRSVIVELSSLGTGLIIKKEPINIGMLPLLGFLSKASTLNCSQLCSIIIVSCFGYTHLLNAENVKLHTDIIKLYWVVTGCKQICILIFTVVYISYNHVMLTMESLQQYTSAIHLSTCSEWWPGLATANRERSSAALFKDILVMTCRFLERNWNSSDPSSITNRSWQPQPCLTFNWWKWNEGYFLIKTGQPNWKLNNILLFCWVSSDT